jgi:hypothetical protein
MISTHALAPNFPVGFFTDENVKFIQNIVTNMLLKRYKQRIVIERGGVIRVMKRIIEERHETIPKMNQRVAMTLASEFVQHQMERNRNMHWEEMYYFSQSLYDPFGLRTSVDRPKIKLNERRNNDGTLRFYFT